MKLTAEEQVWLDAYRQTLTQQFPGLIEQIIIFGSKARGTATADSDLDLLVVIRQGDWRLKDAVTQPGYSLSIDQDVVPSIMVYTMEEWEQRRNDEAPLWQMVNRDGVVVG
ncbi:MAG: nucleotidyltransferase domain-containing protein [Terriglobia bacterium]